MVEAAEYQFWVNFQRTATARRMIEAHAGTVSGLAVKESVRQARLVERDFERALKLNDSTARDDVSPAWLHYVYVRQAELHLLAADAATGGDRAIQQRAAALALDRAESLQPGLGGGFDQVADPGG